jgi:RimJ/RimL family protein N-acetyltransferase
VEPFDEKDSDRLISWIDSEEMLMQFSGPGFHFPLTRQQLLLNREDENRYAYKLVAIPPNEIIGYAEIYLHEEKTAILSRIIIGEQSYRGKGLCKQIINHLLAISFNRLGAERAVLHVFDGNIPAVKCYKGVGFEINESKLKKRELQEETWTALQMVLEKEQWQLLSQSIKI